MHAHAGRDEFGKGGRWGGGSHLSQHNNAGDLIGRQPHFAELFHSDRVIMKHCAAVVRLEERRAACSAGLTKREGGGGKTDTVMGQTRRHHATNYLSVLV